MARWRFVAAMALAQGTLGDIPFRESRLVGKLLDRMAISIARIEVHMWIDACRVAPEDGFDLARSIEEVVPLNRRDHAKVRDCARDAFRIVKTNHRHVGRLDDLKGRLDLREEVAETSDEQFQADYAQHGREGPGLGDAERHRLLILFYEQHRAIQRDLQVRSLQQGMGKLMHARATEPVPEIAGSFA